MSNILPQPQQGPNAMAQSQQGGQQGGTAPTWQGDNSKPSNQRFRSFAERYIIERCRGWDDTKIDEEMYKTIVQARSAYRLARAVSKSIGDDN